MCKLAPRGIAAAEAQFVGRPMVATPCSPVSPLADVAAAVVAVVAAATEVEWSASWVSSRQLFRTRRTPWWRAVP
eukprot:2347780-Amphidinium_carterae.2